MHKENLKKIFRTEYLILLGILVIAAIFRFYKLRTAPDWFMDEGEFIRLADYLSKGNYNFLGIRNSLLLIGRPPLFLWIIAGLFKIFGTDIIILRILTVTCSFFSIGIVFSLAFQSLGKKTAFYTAFLLAILPEYIFYNRIGFSYNWTSLCMLLFVLALWKYIMQDSQRWLLAACLAAGIAFASDYIGVICIIVLALVLVIKHPTHLWKVVIAGVPWLVSMLPLFFIAPNVIWQDLGYTLFWGSGGEGSLIIKLPQMILRYSDMIRRQPLIVLGMVGIFTLSDQRLRGLILLVVSGVFVLLLPSRTLLGHYLLPEWPFLMIGLGSILDKTVTYFFLSVKSSLVNLKISQRWMVNDTLRSFLGSIGSTLITFLFVFLPITWMIILNIGAFIEPLIPSMALPENPWKEGFIPAVDAEAVAKKISSTLNPEDFVVAPGVIYWMLPCNGADMRTVVVYEYGGMTLGLRDITKNRFTVNSSLSNAKYAVVDESWRIWLVNIAPEIATMLDEVKSWPLVMNQGDLQLFCNPKYCH